ncbi:Uncharacterised protein [Mycobacteroides abscessus subsp. abscessus]|uniref:Uncharacterized protein n=1 Tax=Mycobacteroides abscessus (strain ATCC 19977 / DSM 44196 / CCUG 20993 / CIP 104536 / JCM 13569 / NCTC 13031 / TMC 1543 / L948) TaxID=561007 RepID=B1MFC7_MYCA9|nr:hypothetical protein [Mycobacteroides abscessus]CAM60327.1 Hypothetical protein MAB_0227 [Mycobacteroides abscessus ATCC 19977]SHU36145.1 Uncharacterised protein [Mycobacteroides abscessus subsp. abscessus]QAB11135.1 hypothetical protein EFV83_12210 [Mycobacteroides abscessus]RIR64718.1 hypothetical protein D2E68_26700 [Mycobacteroides abscessus]
MTNLGSMPTQALHDELFKRIIANYEHAKIPCQYRNLGCRRPAKWLWIRKHSHGGERFTLCGRHKNYWRRGVNTLIAVQGYYKCPGCETRYHSADEVASVRRL